MGADNFPYVDIRHKNLEGISYTVSLQLWVSFPIFSAKSIAWRLATVVKALDSGIGGKPLARYSLTRFNSCISSDSKPSVKDEK
ncbi:MAG: hypothetical protein AAGJ08_20680 [Cyanobacteria bacterium P01_H01_bin.35]